MLDTPSTYPVLATQRAGLVVLTIGTTEAELSPDDAMRIIDTIRDATYKARIHRKNVADAEADAADRARAEAELAETPGGWLVSYRRHVLGRRLWVVASLGDDGALHGVDDPLRRVGEALNAAPPDIWWHFYGKRTLHLWDPIGMTRCGHHRYISETHGFREPHPKWKRCAACAAAVANGDTP